MEFEIKYEQTKKFMSGNLRPQIIRVVIAYYPILFFSYFFASIINFYLGDKKSPTLFFQLWFVLVFLLFNAVLAIIVHRRLLERYFSHRGQFSVLLRFNQTGLFSESEFGTAMIKWIAVIKTKRTSRSFLIQITSGDIYIPIEHITKEQRLFVEEMVSKATAAA